MTLSVLVVCLGNICRSPMGEAVLRHEAAKRGINIQVDSAGTAGYHAGDNPDIRTISTCKKVKEVDFSTFQYILAADESNLRNLIAKKPAEGTATVRLWGSYLDNKPIADPYYEDITAFERCFQQCKRLSHAFLDEVVGKVNDT